MSASFKHRMLVWLWNLVDAFVSGIAAALAAVPLGNITGAVDFTFRQLVVVAVCSGVASAVRFVRANRLPSIDTVEQPAP